MDAVWSEPRSKRGWGVPNPERNCLTTKTSYHGQGSSTPAALQRYRAVWVNGLLGSVLLLLLLPGNVVASEAFCGLSGLNREYSIVSCHLGLELWEEGKRSQNIFQKWYLKCHLEKGKPPSCTLERTQILFWTEQIGADVATHRHATSEGTLRVVSADMKNGGLEFDVIYPGGERMPVVMRLKPSFHEPNPDHFQIESFQAKDVVRTRFTENLVAQEWRIPDYTYTLNVPILMFGKKRASERERDDLVRSLSPNDRLVFKQIEDGRCLDTLTWLKEEPIRAVIKPYEARSKEVERKMTETKEEWKRIELRNEYNAIHDELWGRDDVQKFLRDKMEKCLVDAGMSPKGRRVAANLLLRGFQPSGQKAQNR